MVIHDDKVENELLRKKRERVLDSATPPLERLASPLSRFAAFIVDYVVLCWPFVLLTTSPFMRELRDNLLSGDEFAAYVAAALVACTGVATIIFYQTIFHWIAGATPGKFIFGLKLEPLWSNFERPTFWTSLGRSCCWCLQFLLLGVPFLGVMADPNRRPWHDRWANTVVVAKRRRLAVPPPSIYEIALVRSLTWAIVGLFCSATFFLAAREFKIAQRNYSFARNLVAVEPTCEAVDNALEDWPQESGEEPQRLSVAMALFAAGDLDKSCLKAEAESSLAATLNPGLVYLAKSFVYSDNQDLSDMYLEEVCQTNANSDECHLAEVIEGLAQEDLDRVESRLDRVDANAHVYLTIWALRQFVRVEDFNRAERFLARLPDHQSLARFLLPLRAQILWGLSRKEESRAAADSALDVLTGYEKIQFASWFCFEEMSESCARRNSRPCGAFLRQIERADEALVELHPALALMKSDQCAGEEPAVLASSVAHPDVREYALMVEAQDINGLRELWANEALRPELRDEIARHIVESSEPTEPIRENWLSRTRGLSWKRLGISLLNHDLRTKAWSSAVQIAERIWNAWPSSSDHSILQSYIVALYRSGQRARARQLLEETASVENRLPASVSGFYEIREKLLRGK